MNDWYSRASSGELEELAGLEAAIKDARLDLRLLQGDKRKLVDRLRKRLRSPPKPLDDHPVSAYI